MRHILLLNGPNLNLLGQREPEQYGSSTLTDIEQRLIALAEQDSIQLSTFQSNGEGELVDRIHQAYDQKMGAIIINPGAFTHTSIALRDALLGVNIPFIEIHISNIFARETFRQHSYLSDIAQGAILGCGVYGYELAYAAAKKLLP